MPKKTVKSQCVIEIVAVKQIVNERPAEYTDIITSTQSAGRFAMDMIGTDAAETVLLLCLDTKNQINAIHRVFTGSLNSSVAHPREIFRSAIMNNAARIMVFHNHPSGNCNPSEADLIFTRRLQEAGELIGIELLDHIIVGPSDFLSLREYGVI